MLNTTVQATLNLSDLKRLSIPLPPESVRSAILDVLGALDDKIVANARLVETISRLAVAAVSTSDPAVPLAEVVLHNKSMVDPASLGTGQVSLFSLPSFDATRTPARTDLSTIKSGKFAVRGPAVLVSKLNPRFPRLWDVPTVGHTAALASTEFLVLESLFSSSTVLWAVVSQPSFGAALEAQVSGTSGSHQRVRPDDVLATAVVDPRALSDDTHALVTSLGARRAAAQDESQLLAATRDALLPLLMSGKVRVKDAERVVSNAV